MIRTFLRMPDPRNTVLTGQAANLIDSTADPLPVLHINPGHFASLLQNLIHNSIKYRTGLAPRIHVSVSKTDREHLFGVSDNGIDPKYHSQIFEVFKRLHGGKMPGTGVGLAICKRVVEHYGDESGW